MPQPRKEMLSLRSKATMSLSGFCASKVRMTDVPAWLTPTTTIRVLTALLLHR